MKKKLAKTEKMKRHNSLQEDKSLQQGHSIYPPPYGIDYLDKELSAESIMQQHSSDEQQAEIQFKSHKTEEDFTTHQEKSKKGFIGGSIRDIRDFMELFDDEKATPLNQRIGLHPSLHDNKRLKLKIIAKQLLTNFHSTTASERRNARFMIRQLDLPLELIKKIGLNDEAFKDDETVTRLIEFLPSVL